MGASILIVDDDDLLREAVRIMLEEIEYEVLEAENAIEGIRQAKAYIPGIILCDVRMGEMNGFGVLEALKKDPNTRHIPVIMMSGLALDNRRYRDVGVEADYYLPKPFTVTQLIDLLESIELSAARTDTAKT